MWKCRQPLASALAWAVALFVLVGGTSWLRAQAPSRDALLNAFDELRAKAKSEGIYDPKSFIKLHVPRGGTGETVSVDLYAGRGVKERLARFRGVPVNDGSTASDVKMAIKVWAVPLRDDGSLTSMKVHLGKHRWRPRERMAIFFETAIPVQVGFYQEFENSDGGEPRLVQVLPDKDPAKFRDARKTVQPGFAYRFPVDIELDDNRDDEVMVIVVVASGTDPDLPPKDQTVTQGKPAKHHAVFSRRYVDALNEKAKEARRLVSRFRATASSDANAAQEDIDPGSMIETTGDPDKVATIAYGDNDFGMLRIRLRKAKN